MHPYHELAMSDLYLPKSMRDSWFCLGPFWLHGSSMLNRVPLEKNHPMAKSNAMSNETTSPHRPKPLTIHKYEFPRQSQLLTV